MVLIDHRTVQLPGDGAGGVYPGGGGAGLAVPAGCARTIAGQRPQATDRVIRGGGWGNFARSCRAATRGRIEPRDRWNNLGVRVAAVPPGGQSSTSE
jgi:formylglycine-generating enzyme required for sulfatase activity